MTDRINRHWRLAAHPEGLAKASDFEWRESPVRTLEDDELLVRVLYLSLDPATRAWISEYESYVKPVAVGEIVRGATIGEVVESRNARFAAGDIVTGALGWQSFGISDGKGLLKISNAAHLPIPLSDWFAVFGHVGLTAYVGLLDIGQPKSGETLVVSAAAGAVGSLVGQIGKIHGLRVVGIAGGEEKCRWVTEECGFDAAIDYKSEDVPERLKELCPDGIDIDFENVGGEILEAVIGRLAQNARIVLCGMISQYNVTEAPPGPRNLVNVLMKRGRIEGFIALDHYARAPEAFRDLGTWCAEGRLMYRMDIVDGLENAPIALNKLFDGSNRGKLMIRVAESASSTTG